MVPYKHPTAFTPLRQNGLAWLRGVHERTLGPAPARQQRCRRAMARVCPGLGLEP